MRFKQAVHNVMELFTFCHRLEQYLCSVCEFERRGVISWLGRGKEKGIYFIL